MQINELCDAVHSPVASQKASYIITILPLTFAQTAHLHIMWPERWKVRDAVLGGPTVATSSGAHKPSGAEWWPFLSWTHKVMLLLPKIARIAGITVILVPGMVPWDQEFLNVVSWRQAMGVRCGTETSSGKELWSFATMSVPQLSAAP